MREVAGLAVHIDVLRVEARAAFRERLQQHRAHLGEQAAHRADAEGVAGRLGMDAGGPQRLVRIDVADAADHGLIQEDPLDRRTLRAHPGDHRGLVEGVVERIAADVDHLRGDERLVAPPSSDAPVGRGHQIVDRQRAEGPLIGEHDGEVAVVRVMDVQAHPLVPFHQGTGCPEKHLSAHPEVGDDGAARGVVGGCRSQRHPEELAASRDAGDQAAGQRALERAGIAVVTRQRAGIARVHRDDARPDHRRCETGADDLDLGKLRHVR